MFKNIIKTIIVCAALTVPAVSVNAASSSRQNTTRSSKPAKPAKPSKPGRQTRNNTFKNQNSHKPSAPVAVDYTAENPLLKTDSHLITQRKYFADAKQAIKSGDVAKALTIQKNFLQDYPLSIWIDYWALTTDMNASKFNDVLKFISSDDHKELSNILKDKYIKYLAEHGQFKKLSVLIGDKPFDDNADMTPAMEGKQCRYYEALWHLNKAGVTAQTFANRMYLQLRPYSKDCEGLIGVWKSNGYLQDKVKLDKFERAYITRSYNETTRRLATQLSDSKFSGRVALSMSMYDNPSKVLSLEPKSGSQSQHRAAVLAFKRYANLEPKDAAASFENFSKRFSLSSVERLEIIQLISQGFLGRNSTREEISWVDRNLPAVNWTEDIKISRIRRAIWFKEWKIVYSLYDQLSENARNEINWRYWKARSARELGIKDEGNRLMSEVAKDRSFFGFLAAEELGRSLPFNHEKLSKQAHWPSTAAKNKAAVRFFEFKVLNDSNASIEWREVAKYGTNDEAMLMAEWAISNGNEGYAIDSVIAGKRWDALDYRFPKPYFSIYSRYSNQTQVPISFLYGISRQESMLNPVIKSPVGAVGLMQLMPATAKMVSKENHWSYKGPSDLVVPENNIRLGSAYLRDMLARFDNNRVLAAAAYNAGPNRISRWKSHDGLNRDTAQFVENIPFKETRLYVQNVLLYDAIYKKLLTGKENGSLLRSLESKYRY